MAERSSSYGSSMMAQLTPVVKWLLGLNLGIYFGDLLIFDHAIRNFGNFSIESAIREGAIWKFITFQFVHASLGHVLFNLIGLFFFGPWMERWWGSQKFVFFYLACGVGGALFHSLLVFAGILLEATIVGASAGIYGTLVGVAVIAPFMKVSLLIPPVTLTMRQLALIWLGISVFFVVFKIGGNEGGEAGHLGGAIVGYLLLRGGSISKLLGGGLMQKKSIGPRKDIKPKIRPRTVVDLRSSSEVDAILDKISRDGFQSLSKKELELLKRASQSKQP